MRSLLFVPGDSERKITKALAAQADVVILDLEDSVAPAHKPRARRLAAEALSARGSGPKLYVRINSLSSGLPGTTEGSPDLPPFSAPSLVSSRSLALRAPSSGPWQEKQFSERIGRIWRLKSTGATDAPLGLVSA